MTMNTVIKLKTSNFLKLEEDLTTLRLKPERDYQLKFDYNDNKVIIEFMNPMKASLWRIAVGYKYI